MGKAQRDKGQRGERELLGLLSGELGTCVKRNLSQTRGGGADCIDVKGYSIEIKFQETLNINAWWSQALSQCQGKEKPVLFYRKSRQPWTAVMLLSDVNSDYTGSDTIFCSLPTACMIIRENL